MILVTVFFLVYTIFRFKEAVLLTAATLIFMNNLMSGIPDVKLFYIVALFQILVFFLKGYNHTYKGEQFPLLILLPLILNFIEYVACDYSNKWHYLSVTLVSTISYFFFPFVFWHTIETINDVVSFCKKILTFFLFVGCYALVEVSLGYNILTQWANEVGVMVGEGGVNTAERFGITRCNSILPWCSALGMNSALVLTVLMFLNYYRYKFVKFEKIMIFLLPICVLLSGTRAQFVVFSICFIGMLPLITEHRAKYFKIIFWSLFCLIILAIPFIPHLLNTITNIGGSDTDMRMRQLEISLYYWNQSPWVGHGLRFIGEYVKPDNPDIYGAESIVFVMLMERGLLGLIGYYLIALCLSIWCFKHFKPLAIVPIAFAVGKTMGAVIGVEYVIPLTLCILCVKAQVLKIQIIK